MNDFYDWIMDTKAIVTGALWTLVAVALFFGMIDLFR